MKPKNLLVVLLLTTFLIPNVLVAQELDTVLTGGWVFQTETGKFTKNKHLGIKDGRFVKLDDDAKIEADKTVELGDKQYILPGIIDCHAHYNVKLVRRRREEFKVTPVVYLANGVTTTFSCGEFDPEKMLQLRKDIESGKQIGPRLLNSGPYFGRARPGWKGNEPEQQVRDEVDFWAKQGVGGFKAKAISPKHLKPLVEQAHKHGLTVTGHLDSGFRNTVNPQTAIELGIDRVEHFLGGATTPPNVNAYTSLQLVTPGMREFKEIAKIYIDKKVWYDATLTAYGYFGDRGSEEFKPWVKEREFFTPYVQELVKKKQYRDRPMFGRIYKGKLKTIAEFWRMGGQITLGTDHFSDGNFLPGFGAHREIDAFVRSGIPPSDVLKIATINGAKALKIDKDHGSIEPGKVADLFIIEGNPLKNIRNTRNVQTVIRAGKLHDSKKLLESVKGKLGPTDKDEAKKW